MTVLPDFDGGIVGRMTVPSDDSVLHAPTFVDLTLVDNSNGTVVPMTEVDPRTDSEREADEQAAASRPVVDDETPDEPDKADNKPVTVAEDWAYDVIEFKGDKLGIRVPTQQALTALTLGTGKFVSPQTRQDMTQLFMVNHLCPVSWERVLWRMSSPDDPEYNDETVGELSKIMVDKCVDKVLAAQKAKASSAK